MHSGSLCALTKHYQCLPGCTREWELHLPEHGGQFLGPVRRIRSQSPEFALRSACCLLGAIRVPAWPTSCLSTTKSPLRAILTPSGWPPHVLSNQSPYGPFLVGSGLGASSFGLLSPPRSGLEFAGRPSASVDSFSRNLMRNGSTTGRTDSMICLLLAYWLARAGKDRASSPARDWLIGTPVSNSAHRN